MAEEGGTTAGQRITENLVRCAELTELCLELRCAVLKQSYPEQEARRMVMREILEAKERRWRQSPS